MTNANKVLVDFTAELRPTRVRLHTYGMRLDCHERAIARKAQRGEQGPKGDKGDTGPMPMHRWEGTKLQFQQGPDGETWGTRSTCSDRAGGEAPMVARMAASRPSSPRDILRWAGDNGPADAIGG